MEQLKKGKSGFYECVNFHLKTKYNGNILMLEQAQHKVAWCVKSLQQSGFPIMHSWIDQNCCYWSIDTDAMMDWMGEKETPFSLTNPVSYFHPCTQKYSKVAG
jgi:hypothetical protein